MTYHTNFPKDHSSVSDLLRREAEHYCNSGRAKLEQGDWKGAEQDFITASGIVLEKNARYHWWLGKLYMKTGDYGKAAERFIKAKEGRLPMNISKDLALAYFRLNNYTDALRALIHAEAFDPEDHWIQFSIGRCYFVFGTYEEKVSKEVRLWKENPLIPEPDRDQYYVEALKYLNKSIQLNPKYPYAYWMRGQILYAFGLMEESARDHSNAIKYKPDEVQFYNGWEMAHRSIQ